VQSFIFYAVIATARRIELPGTTVAS